MKKKYRNRLPKGMEVENTNIRVENGEVLVEVEFKEKFEPKDGDFLIDKDGDIFIYSDAKTQNSNFYSCYCGTHHGKIRAAFCYNWVDKNGCRFATPEEKDLFLERIEKECLKRWNSEKKCLEDIRWEPKAGELFWFVGMDFNVYSTHYESSFSMDSLRVKTLNCFKTEQATQKVAGQIKEIFKYSKAE